MAIRIINISEARQRFTELVRNLDDPLYITVYGKPRAVVVSYKTYEALLEKIEELEDSLDVLARRDEPTTDWEEVEAKLGQVPTPA